jgi:hypothetical protein
MPGQKANATLTYGERGIHHLKHQGGKLQAYITQSAG